MFPFQCKVNPTILFVSDKHSYLACIQTRFRRCHISLHAIPNLQHYAENLGVRQWQSSGAVNNFKSKQIDKPDPWMGYTLKMVSRSALYLVAANVLVPIAILTFATGFFPYKPFLSGLAEVEDLSEHGWTSGLPDAPFDKVIFMVVDALRR